MSAYEAGVTGKGMDIIQNWSACVAHAKRCETELERAKKELERLEHNLGSWMSPDDAKAGESFCIWVGDGLLRVELNGKDQEGIMRYLVSWRKRPGAKCATEMHL